MWVRVGGGECVSRGGKGWGAEGRRRRTGHEDGEEEEDEGGDGQEAA